MNGSGILTFFPTFSGEVDGKALEEMFRQVDTDKDMKLNANERRALRESLENKKVRCWRFVQ